jgi:hypothetical protein
MVELQDGQRRAGSAGSVDVKAGETINRIDVALVRGVDRGPHR